MYRLTLSQLIYNIDQRSDLEALATMIDNISSIITDSLSIDRSNQRYCSICSTAYRITEAHPPACPYCNRCK